MATADMVHTVFIEVTMMHVVPTVGVTDIWPTAIAFLCKQSLPLKEKDSKDAMTFRDTYAVVLFTQHCSEGQYLRDTF